MNNKVLWRDNRGRFKELLYHLSASKKAGENTIAIKAFCCHECVFYCNHYYFDINTDNADYDDTYYDDTAAAGYGNNKS